MSIVFFRAAPSCPLTLKERLYYEVCKNIENKLQHRVQFL